MSVTSVGSRESTHVEIEPVKPVEPVETKPAPEPVKPDSSFENTTPDALNLDGAPPVDPNVPTVELGPGDRGLEVAQLQEALSNLGYLPPERMANGTGNYGKYTTAAVEQVQLAHGLPPTGVYDAATQQALLQEDALFQDPSTMVEQDYQALLGRPPTPSELSGATSQLLTLRNEGATLSEMQTALETTIAATPEFQALHGPGAGQPLPGYDERLAATGSLEGQFDNPFAVANQMLGFNASDNEVSGLLSQEMQEWVPNDRDCASFVTGALTEAGWVPDSSYTASVLQMTSNLSKDPNFVSTTDLSQLQPGDPIVIQSPSAAYGHAVLYAGQGAAGNHLYVGSNNVNGNGTQQVTYGVLDPAKLLGGFHYTGDRGNPYGTADGTVNTFDGMPAGTLQVGDRGVDVLKLQNTLVDQGYLDPKAVEGQWGIYGPETAAAVQKLQLEKGIVPARGNFDVRTQTALTQPAAAPRRPDHPLEFRTYLC